MLLGLLDRLPGGDPLLDTEEDDEEEGTRRRSVDYGDLGPGGRRLNVDNDEYESEPGPEDQL